MQRKNTHILFTLTRLSRYFYTLDMLVNEEQSVPFPWLLPKLSLEQGLAVFRTSAGQVTTILRKNPYEETLVILDPGFNQKSQSLTLTGASSKHTGQYHVSSSPPVKYPEVRLTVKSKLGKNFSINYAISVHEGSHYLYIIS